MGKIILRGSKQLIHKSQDLCDGFVVGVYGLSVNISYLLNSVSEINDLPKNKQIYVSLNKNIVNSDLKYLEEVMTSLSKMNIAGVIFYDIALVNINKKLGLNLNLIWDQEHFTTNYFTANFWNSEGVLGMHISSEITLKEIEEIISNTRMNLFLTIFGHLPMFNSFRHLVNNYLTAFNIESSSEIHYMEEKGKLYPIIDNEFGTTVYSDCVLNALDEYIELDKHDITFVVDSFLLDESFVIEVLNMIQNKKIDNERIEELFKNVDKGFLYKETIYKVKK